jgi:hypothetical protein
MWAAARLERNAEELGLISRAVEREKVSMSNGMVVYPKEGHTLVVLFDGALVVAILEELVTGQLEGLGLIRSAS